jgi:hypothetical protein
MDDLMKFKDRKAAFLQVVLGAILGAFLTLTVQIAGPLLVKSLGGDGQNPHTNSAKGTGRSETGKTPTPATK